MGFDDRDGKANQVQRNNHRKYFLPRVDIKDYNVLIDGRNFYDQNINDETKKCEELRGVMIGKENYETGSFLGFAFYKKEYRLVVCDLSKPKIFDSNRKTS